jgi:hypothetical protein
VGGHDTVSVVLLCLTTRTNWHLLTHYHQHELANLLHEISVLLTCLALVLAFVLCAHVLQRGLITLCAAVHWPHRRIEWGKPRWRQRASGVYVHRYMEAWYQILLLYKIQNSVCIYASHSHICSIDMTCGYGWIKALKIEIQNRCGHDTAHRSIRPMDVDMDRLQAHVALVEVLKYNL